MHGEPHCRASPPRRPLCQPGLSRGWALRAGGISAQPSPAAHACACTLRGYASPVPRSEQLASIPADYIRAGNTREQKVCESSSEMCWMRCLCSTGCFRCRDVSLPQPLTMQRQAARLKSSTKASSQLRWPRKRLSTVQAVTAGDILAVVSLPAPGQGPCGSKTPPDPQRVETSCSAPWPAGETGGGNWGCGHGCSPCWGELGYVQHRMDRTRHRGW